MKRPTFSLKGIFSYGSAKQDSRSFAEQLSSHPD